MKRFFGTGGRIEAEPHSFRPLFAKGVEGEPLSSW